MNRPSRRTALVAALVGLVLVVVAVAGVVVVRRVLDDDRTDLEQAMAMAPATAQRFSWTDWSRVRAALDHDDVDATSGASAVRSMLDDGFSADLTSNSALVESAVTLQLQFGFSPASVDWELFSQGEDGASIVMRVDDADQLDTVAEDLRALGYTPPGDAVDAWSDEQASLPVSGKVTPELGLIALVDDADGADGGGLVVTSDTVAGLEAARTAVADADADDVPAEVLSSLGSPLTASLSTGAQACRALAMAGADPGEQAEADQLLSQAGPVDPLTGFAIGASTDGGVRVVMSFETEEQARTNADTRAALAAGPAPGQGGAFSDRFAVDSVTAEGTVLVMELDPVEGSYVVSDLSSGPVLFATC